MKMKILIIVLLCCATLSAQDVQYGQTGQDNDWSELEDQRHSLFTFALTTNCAKPRTPTSPMACIVGLTTTDGKQVYANKSDHLYAVGNKSSLRRLRPSEIQGLVSVDTYGYALLRR